MTAPELKPCPFCGGPARYQKDHTTECRDSIWCATCDFGVFDPDWQGSVVIAWNSRADLPPTLEQAKALPEIKALVEALLECISHCQNTGRGNALVNDRIYERVEETARAALHAIGEGKK